MILFTYLYILKYYTFDYLRPRVPDIHHHVSIVTYMIHGIMMDERCGVPVGDLLTCAVYEERILKPDSDTTPAGSLTQPPWPGTGGKQGMNL